MSTKAYLAEAREKYLALKRRLEESSEKDRDHVLHKYKIAAVNLAKEIILTQPDLKDLEPSRLKVDKEHLNVVSFKFGTLRFRVNLDTEEFFWVRDLDVHHKKHHK